MRTLFILIASGVSAWAQAGPPAVGPYGIINDASQIATGLPAGSIARGSRFQISGENLGPPGALEHRAFPLVGSLGGVTVTAQVGMAIYNCWPVYVSSNLVRAVLPSTVPAGPAAIRVTYNAQTGNPVTINVVAHSPGVYSVNGGGSGPGRIFNFASATQLFSSLTRPGRPNLVATLHGTGFGARAGSDDTAPAQQNLPYTIDVTVGGVTAAKLFAGRSTALPGTDLITFRIPTNAPLGCYVPVQVTVNGAVSNVVTMAISATGTPCQDPSNPVSSQMRSGGTLAVAAISRSDISNTPSNTIIDKAAASGRTLPADEFAFDRMVSFPPPGTCTAYTDPGNLLQTAIKLTRGTNLSLGTLNLQSSAGSRAISFISPDAYFEYLGAQNAGITPTPPAPFLNAPDTFTWNGSGGASGNFSIAALLGVAPVWTNAAAIATVNRSSDLTLQWSGASGRQVFISGTAYAAAADASTVFLCVAAAGATSFTVPSRILSLLPAVPDSSAGTALLSVGALAGAGPATTTTPGLNLAALFLANSTKKPVIVQ